MSGVKEHLEAIRSTLPENVVLVAVSKFHPAEAIMEAYNDGQRLFGESRAQELAEKASILPKDICWHFIGHLQTNKVRPVVSNASLIESIDSLRVLEAVEREATKQGKRMDVLLQVHVAQEETKTGFTPDELLDFFRNREHEQLQSVRLCGLMAMASNTDDNERVRRDFTTVANLHKEIKEMCPDLEGFNTLSMGMSHDYLTAIECGANMVRIGSTIFGERL